MRKCIQSSLWDARNPKLSLSGMKVEVLIVQVDFEDVHGMDFGEEGLCAE